MSGARKWQQDIGIPVFPVAFSGPLGDRGSWTRWACGLIQRGDLVSIRMEHLAGSWLSMQELSKAKWQLHLQVFQELSANVRESHCGPICVWNKSPTPKVLLKSKNGGGQRSECHPEHVAKRASFCLPPFSATAHSTQEDKAKPGRGDLNNPLLAKVPLVSRDTLTATQWALSSASKSRPLVPWPNPPSTTCLFWLTA